MSRANPVGIWRLNHRLITSVISEAADNLEAVGLDTKEFFVLDDVEECPYPAELAKRLTIPKASITGYIKSLERKGFVRREIDPGDLRRHRITITRSGQESIVNARKALSHAFSRRLARLDAGEREALQVTLQKLCD